MGQTSTVKSITFDAIRQMTQNGAEIRIISLIALRTGNNNLLRHIDPMYSYAGLYPEIMGKGNEMLSDEIVTKVERWPDVKEALQKYRFKYLTR